MQGGGGNCVGMGLGSDDRRRVLVLPRANGDINNITCPETVCPYTVPRGVCKKDISEQGQPSWGPVEGVRKIGRWIKDKR